MLMDDPRDWKARISSLENAISETEEMMEVVRDDHAAEVMAVFNAEMTDEMATPFEAIQVALGDMTPRQFLKLPARGRVSTIPKPLRKMKKRGFYQLVKETMQVDNCIKVLQALYDFAGEGFTFFMDGYYDKKNLPVAPQCPPRSVMRTLVNQVSYDLSVIQHAVNQRRRHNGKATKQGLAVAMADHLATMALVMAVDEGFLPQDTTVITYLAKSVRARLIPYYDALLISVAYASIQNGVHPTRDYLALSHEIGHHLYWNGRHPQSGAELRDLLLQNVAKAGITAGDWRLNWLEEIFCDTYALLLAGPVIVLDFQDMLDDDMSSHFREDTDKHPIPEIRPLIQTNILRRAKDDDGNVIYAHECDKLDENWRNWLATHPLQASYRPRGTAAPMTGQAIIDALEPLITAILDTVPGFVPTERDYTGMEGGNDLAKLYEEFQSNVMPVDDNRLVNMYLDGNGTEEELASILDSYSETSFLKHIEEVVKKKPDQIDSAEWLQLLRSFGWSSEGPLGSGGLTSNGSSFSLSVARINRNKDVIVAVTVLNDISCTLDLKDTQSNQTANIYCAANNTTNYTFKNVGANAGRIIVTNATTAVFINYPAGS